MDSTLSWVYILQPIVVTVIITSVVTVLYMLGWNRYRDSIELKAQWKDEYRSLPPDDTSQEARKEGDLS